MQNAQVDESVTKLSGMAVVKVALCSYVAPVVTARELV